MPTNINLPNINLNDPMVQTYAIPLLASLLAIGLIRFFMGGVRGAMLASLGVGIGFLTAFIMLKGVPLWPVTSAVHLMGWLVIGGLILGLLLDLIDPPEGLVKILSFALPVVIVFWLGFLLKGNRLSVELALTYGALMAVGYLAFDRLNHDRDHGVSSPIAGAMAALGLGLVAHYSKHSFAPLAFALALSSLAFAIWNWPRSRFPWGWSGTLLTAGPLLLIAATMVLSRNGMGFVTLMALMALLSKPIADWLIPSRGMAAAFVQIFVGTLPILAAVASVHFNLRPF